MKNSILLSVLTGVLLGANLSQAQTVATDPVGFTTQACPANSDTLVSVPFTRPPEFVGAVQSVAGNAITVSGTPFTANQFVYAAGTQPKTYFVLIGPHAATNPKEGFMYQVIGNGTNTLTLNLNGDSISGVVASTQILVIPYHTLSSLFPASDANISFIPSPSAFVHGTEILIPNYSGVGTNLSAAITYYYLSGVWRKVGDSADHGDDAMVNGGYFTLRNAATGTTLTTLGSVLVKKATIPLFTRASANAGDKQDNFVSVIRPINVKLDDLGLITSGAFVASTNAFNHTDELLVFNNAATGRNKSASASYFYFNSAWRKVGQPITTDVGTDTIPTGAGFIIRKAPTAAGTTSYWTNAPTY